MTNKTYIIITIALCCVGLSGCVKEKLNEAYNKQEEKIDSYISSQMSKDSTLTYTNNKGSNRLTRVQGSGEALESHGTISFYYAGYTFNGGYSSSGLFCTNHEQTANDSRWNLTDGDFSLLTINLKETDLLEGLRLGLEGVRTGEECEIIFSGRYAFGNSPYGIIPANNSLLYKIWVLGVSNE